MDKCHERWDSVSPVQLTWCRILVARESHCCPKDISIERAYRVSTTGKIALVTLTERRGNISKEGVTEASIVKVSCRSLILVELSSSRGYLRLLNTKDWVLTWISDNNCATRSWKETGIGISNEVVLGTIEVHVLIIESLSVASKERHPTEINEVFSNGNIQGVGSVENTRV